MTLLGIATNGPRGSLAIGNFESGKIKNINQIGWDKKAMHSELATVKLQELLQQSGQNLKDITHIAVVIGPGSFTGIRVGVNLARSLAYGLDIPVATFNTLELLAAKNLPQGQRGLVAIKALREFYYNAAFKNTDQGLVELLPSEASPRQSWETRLKPDFRLFVEDESPGFSVTLEAADIFHWLDQWPNTRPFVSWEYAKPLYIRGSEAEEKLKLGLLKPV